MKVLLDTNVILDVLLRRENFYGDSVGVVRLCATDIEGIFTVNQTTDIFYILKRSGASNEDAKQSIIRLLKHIGLVDSKKTDVNHALKSKMYDFEDGIIDSVAVREKTSYIITRNTTDFKNSMVPAIHPRDFLKLMNSR